MNTKSFKTFHWVAVVIAVIGIAYLSLYFSEAQAVHKRTVGTISVTQFVPNAGNGDEFVTLTFSGIVGQDAPADLTGWSIHNSDGAVYDLSQVILTNVGSVRICEEGATTDSCAHHWDGNDVFNDDGDVMRIVANDNSTVVNISWDTSEAGVSIQGSGAYTANVYTSGDKIGICSLQKSGNLKFSNANVQKITRDIQSDITTNEGVTPPFVYERNKALSYHPGINWTADGKAKLAAGCK